MSAAKTRCKECGGPVTIMPNVRDIFGFPKDPATCVYNSWRRNGVLEDAGICIGARRRQN